MFAGKTMTSKAMTPIAANDLVDSRIRPTPRIISIVPTIRFTVSGYPFRCYFQVESWPFEMCDASYNI